MLTILKIKTFRISFILLLAGTTLHAQYLYPFKNPDLDIEIRIDNILSLLTLEEKIICLGTNPSIPRLGIKGTGHIEVLHGVALGRPGPYAITWTQHHIPAILHMTHNSQEQGTAFADVLFGDYNPGGKLVQTWPRSLEQLPPMLDYDIRNGRTYPYFKGTPLYPFGYGLSYTTFTLSDFKTSADILKENGVITVNVQVKNTGKVKGDEVVQLYIQHLNSIVTRPKKELKAFKRVTLLPGEQKNLQLQLTADQLRYWNETSRNLVLENDKVKLMAGTSSADIKFQKVLNVSK